MKKIAISAFACFLFIACNKEKDNSFVVKFVTSGNNVTQFKIYQGSTEADKSVPFSGTRDTTIVVTSTTMVKLDSKANSNNLSGAIFVNGVQVAAATDTDTDGDGKSEVKLEYTVTK